MYVAYLPVCVCVCGTPTDNDLPIDVSNAPKVAHCGGRAANQARRGPRDRTEPNRTVPGAVELGLGAGAGQGPGCGWDTVILAVSHTI